MKSQTPQETLRPEQRPERPVDQPETLPVREPSVDRKPERPWPFRREQPAGVPPPPSGIPPLPPRVPSKSPVVQEIESILAEDLRDVYAKMSPEEQAHFRAEGEQAATNISRLLNQVKIKTKAILNIIRSWLRLIPGVNRFFLEQEAKIKADRILAIAKKNQPPSSLLNALFQFGLPATTTTPPLASTGDVAKSLLEQPIIVAMLILASLVALALIVVAIVRFALRRMNRLPLSLQYVVLRITVPKEAGRKDQNRPEDPKELLAAAETLFLNLGGIKPERQANVLRNAWNNFWFGRADHLAFEIVADKGLITFYAAVPKHLQRLVELQMHAQYPKAQIEETEDYNIFSPQGVILGATLGLTKRSMFSIRTFKKLDSDPLNAVTNALSKLAEGEGAAMQLLIRPANRSWRSPGQRVARLIQKGKTYEEAMALASGGLWRSLGKAGGAIGSSLKTKNPEEEMKKSSLPPPLTPMEQELVKALEEKASKHAFDVNLRLVVSAPTVERARTTLANLYSTFSQYEAQESSTGFRRKPVLQKGKFVRDFIYRHFVESDRFILNTEEVTSLYHLPLPTTETPNILWLQARKAPAPTTLPKEGMILGKSVYRGVETVVRIKREDRRRHVYVIGMTGVGKSVLMEEMAKQDVNRGEGVCIVDPHGSFVESVLGCIPKERADDVILFDPSFVERPMGLNMLEAHSPEERDFAVQEMIAIFYKLFPPEMIGPMFEHNMRNAMLTLMEDEAYPGTIADIPRMFTDKAFQQYKVKKVKDPVVRAFWEKEMAKTSDFHKSEMLGYLVSKVGRFVENAMMRNIIGQPKSGFNFRAVMDQKKILLVNLSKGKIGDVNAFLLGLIIVSKLQMAALSRADTPEAQRPDFYLYIDEFQNFITDSIATILSEARKYKLNLTLAHQYMGQLVQGQDTKVRDAVLGNVGTMVTFRIGVEDAEILAKQYAPVFDEFDLVNQERYSAYVKLLIDNSASKPFNMNTFPLTLGNREIARAIAELSHLKYGRDRASVEKEILDRSQLGGVSPTPPPAPSAEPRR